MNPTQRVTNTNTYYRTVRNIHPTEVENINRTVIRNENYYPVYNSDVNETVVKNYDCGSDLNSNNCRRVGSEKQW
ncbi:CotD family spore coat protein [Gottfriedia sp. OAE603]|uniref:CotD family spore coat protein n=1 Tax=Gottfriedia sp. OAE603 TaxID=2663872 RepID=UPI00178B46E4